MKLITSLLSVALLGTALPVAVHAANHKLAPKKEYIPVHTTIASVSDTSITTTTNNPKGAKTTTYTVNADTVVEVKGVKATIKDLTPGMRVTVAVGKSADVAERISASDAPHDPPKKQK